MHGLGVWVFQVNIDIKESTDKMRQVKPSGSSSGAESGGPLAGSPSDVISRRRAQQPPRPAREPELQTIYKLHVGRIQPKKRLVERAKALPRSTVRQSSGCWLRPPGKAPSISTSSPNSCCPRKATRPSAPCESDREADRASIQSKI